jgi:hypothetical protein
MTHELALVERRVRRAYEIGRVKYAMVSGLPLMGLSGLAFLAGAGRSLDVVAALALVVTGLTYLWRGQLAARALLSGVVAGLVPLLLALFANWSSPGCTHEATISVCTVACAIGGVLAARRLTEFARAEEKHPAAFVLAVLPAILLGSLGCGCIGYVGVLAMAGALTLASLPEMLRWVRS